MGIIQEMEGCAGIFTVPQTPLPPFLIFLGSESNAQAYFDLYFSAISINIGPTDLVSR